MAALQRPPVASPLVARAEGQPPTNVADSGTCGVDLEVVTGFAVRAICHTPWHVSCGVSVCTGGRAPEVLAAVDDIAVRTAWLQHQFQQGPDVLPSGSELVVSRDLGDEPRWPDFGRMCVAVLGLRSMVSVSIPVHEGHASMSYFSAEPSAFDHLDVDAALRLAHIAAASVESELPALAAVHARMPGSDFSMVAVALDVVKGQRRVSPAEALVLLRQTARERGTSLFGAAAEIVQTGRVHGRSPEPDRASLAAEPRPPVQARIADDATLARHVGGPDMWRSPPEPAVAHPPAPGRLSLVNQTPQNRRSSAAGAVRSSPPVTRSA